MLPYQQYNIVKTPLSTYISKTARWIVFLLSNFGKKDKMQLLAKFKNILQMGFYRKINIKTQK